MVRKTHRIVRLRLGHDNVEALSPLVVEALFQHAKVLPSRQSAGTMFCVGYSKMTYCLYDCIL